MTLGLAVFCVGGGLLIGLFGRRVADREVATGTVLALATALGVLFASLASANASTTTSVLFGNLLAISARPAAWSSARSPRPSCSRSPCSPGPLVFASVDPAVAEARGVPVRALGHRLRRPAGADHHDGRAGRRHAAALRPRGHAGRHRAAAHRPARPRRRARRGARARLGVGRAGARRRWSTCRRASSSCRSLCSRGSSSWPRPARRRRPARRAPVDTHHPPLTCADVSELSPLRRGSPVRGCFARGGRGSG